MKISDIQDGIRKEKLTTYLDFIGSAAEKTRPGKAGRIVVAYQSAIDRFGAQEFAELITFKGQTEATRILFTRDSQLRTELQEIAKS